MYTRTTKDAIELLDTLRDLRRQSLLPFDASLSLVDNAICIDTDPGCLLRPLIVSKRLKDFSTLIKEAPSYETLWVASGQNRGPVDQP